MELKYTNTIWMKCKRFLALDVTMERLCGNKQYLKPEKENST